jgi:hypothetical protein
MSYKSHQFHRVDTDTLVSYKVKCLSRINSPAKAGDDRQYWFNRLELIETELNRRQNEIYQSQDRDKSYCDYLERFQISAGPKDLATI